MLTAGMTSVTFRSLKIGQVVALCKQAKLNGIEWGGDIHVPPCDRAAAQEAVSRCTDAGISVFSYGSYYSVTKQADYAGEFEKIAETCRLLQTNRVRVWAGEKWRHETTDREFELFVSRMQAVARLAEQYHITVCFEHHQNTYCDSGEHAVQALRAIGSPYVRSYWQPICATRRENLSCAAQLKGYVDTLHVYHWRGWERFMLSEGAEDWRTYLQLFSSEKRTIPCLLEFAKEDAIDNFLADAQCLSRLLREIGA